MSNINIVNILAKDQVIENVVKNVCKSPVLKQNEQDLCQDLYLYLLEINNELLNRLYNNNELTYYIIGMVKNNVYSSSSNFYRTYKKFDMMTSDITEIKNI